jgi:hypothetical protein
MTESEFQSAVIEVARLRGWLVMHQRPAQIRPGRWATAIQGDAGFPDLVLARPKPGELIFAELKREKGRVSVMQKVWLRTLAAAGAEAYLWYPSDMPEIITRLSRSVP